MRFVILGAGGVGGVIGGRLFQHGYDVVLIARGAHLAAIQQYGLRLEDPDATAELAVPAVATSAAVGFTDDDVVILATKSQDAAAALDELRRAAPTATRRRSPRRIGVHLPGGKLGRGAADASLGLRGSTRS